MPFYECQAHSDVMTAAGQQKRYGTGAVRLFPGRAVNLAVFVLFFASAVRGFVAVER